MYRTAQSAIAWRIDDLYLEFRFRVGRQEGWREPQYQPRPPRVDPFLPLHPLARRVDRESSIAGLLARDTQEDCRILLAEEVALASETPTSALSFLLQRKKTSRSRPSRASEAGGKPPQSHYIAFMAYLLDVSHDTVAVSGRCGAHVATASHGDDQCLGERRGRRSMGRRIPGPSSGLRFRGEGRLGGLLEGTGG